MAESSPGAAPYEDAVCSNGTTASNSQMEYEPVVSSNPEVPCMSKDVDIHIIIEVCEVLSYAFPKYTVVSLLLGIQVLQCHILCMIF